jgi:hypothetical protein
MDSRLSGHWVHLSRGFGPKTVEFTQQRGGSPFPSAIEHNFHWGPPIPLPVHRFEHPMQGEEQKLPPNGSNGTSWALAFLGVAFPRILMTNWMEFDKN